MRWGRSDTLMERVVTGLLSPGSIVWQWGSSLRRKAYDSGCLKRHEVPVPVVSVGNLTVGGTGKTPVTIDLAKRLIEAGERVAILSRGYRRQSRKSVLVVSDGERILASARESGDEPYMMAQAVPRAVVLVGSNRSVNADLAVQRYASSAILLDDGFQHLPLKRGQDLVLIDYDDNLQNEAVFPAGRLREGLLALKEATQVIVTKVPVDYDVDHLSNLAQLVRRYAPNSELCCCRFVPVGFYRLDNRQMVGEVSEIKGKRVVVFSGIARPDSFAKTLSSLGAHILSLRKFPDHHWYNERDLSLVRSDWKRTGADLILTTEKDAVRIDFDLQQMPVSVLALTTEWLGPAPILNVRPAADALIRTTASSHVDQFRE